MTSERKGATVETASRPKNSFACSGFLKLILPSVPSMKRCRLYAL